MPTINTSRRLIKKLRLSGEVPMPTMSNPVKKARLSREVPKPTMSNPVKKARLSGEVPMPTMSNPVKKARLSGEVPMSTINISLSLVKKARLSGEVPMPTTNISRSLVKKARLSGEVPMRTMNTFREPIKKARFSGEFRDDEIQRKRASARIQMQNMKVSIVIDENKDMMKDLEMLRFESSRRRMEQLGLIIKDDHIEEDDYDDGDAKDIEQKEKCCESSCFDVEKSPNELSASATAIEDNLSTEKALRVAMLKSRFADTIFKAEHLLSQSHKPHPQMKLKEMAKLETKQLNEKAKTIAATKPLSRKEQIERERAAARNALQKMEKSVVIDENKDIIKELEMLSSGSSRRMMEQLGLFLKDDYMDDDNDEDSVLHVEEGELDYNEDLLLEVEEAELIF